MERNILTAQEAADLLKVKKTTVYDMVRRGDLPAVRLGNRLRIARKDVEMLAGSPSNHLPGSESAAAVDSGGIVLCGQDSCLNIISARVSSLPGAKSVLRSYAGSYNSLCMLYQGTADIATSHLWDEESGVYNDPYITRLNPGIPMVVVRLLGRNMGIYTQKGNPKGITGIGDLGTGLKMVNRERGSGTRILLDQKLKAMNLDPAGIRGYTVELDNHLSVASAVARGEADFGMGAESAAMQVSGVDFVFLQKEWYDLVFPKYRLKEETFALMMDYLTGEEFRKEIGAMNNYDLSRTGEVRYL